MAALYLKLQDNRRHRRECKISAKKSNNYANKLNKFYFFWVIIIPVLAQKNKKWGRTNDVKFLYITPCAVGNAPAAIRYKWQAHATRNMACDLF